MKIDQPLIIDPPIKALNHHAMFLGVLFLNPTYHNYFSAHYVNLYYDFSSDFLNFIIPKFYTEEFFFVSTEIGYDIPDIITESCFFEQILHMMDKGYYLYTDVNERYIPNRHAYQKYDFSQSILFYGLETSQKKMNSIAYAICNTDDSFQYTAEELSYFDFIKSIKNMHERNYIHFFKNKAEYLFSFDINLLLLQLKDYINSQNTAFPEQCNPNRVYGIRIYDAVIEYFKSSEMTRPGEAIYLMKTTKLLLEHKQCMLQRIKYMDSNNIIASKNYILEYNKIVQTFTKIHHLSIKYTFTQSVATKELICKEIKKTVEMENSILQKLISDIESNK